MDVLNLHNLDIKGREFPLEKDEIRELVSEENIHGIIVLRDYVVAGYALYTVGDEGGDQVVDIVRLSVNLFMYTREPKILEKVFESIAAGPKKHPTFRVTLSENEIGTDLFDGLLDIGFKGVSVDRYSFHEFGRMADGIVLER